jgi:hypothetical protein
MNEEDAHVMDNMLGVVWCAGGEYRNVMYQIIE